MKTRTIATLIDRFEGSWFFLSNFFLFPVEFDGVIYASNEHAYQAAKTLNLKEREKFTYPGLSPGQAKRMGRKLKLREDWESVKVGIMRELLVKKFTPTTMRRKLFSTMGAELREGNWWHDTFWGICMGECETPHDPMGENMLGKLLMEVRKELMSK